MKKPNKQFSTPIEANKPVFRLIEASSYAECLVTHINSATHTVIIKSMSVTIGDRWMNVCSALVDAATRGVHIELHIDRYALLGMNIATARALLRLRRTDVAIIWHGSIRLNPFSGRDHTKFAVIDDWILGFGGINMKEKGLDAIDFMVEQKNAQVASWLKDTLKGGASHDFLNNGTLYLYDAGIKGESLILHEAAKQLAGSKDALYISKMAPNGPLAHLLHLAKGRCYYNAVSAPRLSLMSKIAAKIDESRTELRSRYGGDRYIHAKCIIADNPNGKKLITGSHNFNTRGVKFGTNECAMVTTDASLIEQVEMYIKKMTI